MSDNCHRHLVGGEHGYLATASGFTMTCYLLTGGLWAYNIYRFLYKEGKYKLTALFLVYVTLGVYILTRVAQFANYMVYNATSTNTIFYPGTAFAFIAVNVPQILGVQEIHSMGNLYLQIKHSLSSGEVVDDIVKYKCDTLAYL